MQKIIQFTGTQDFFTIPLTGLRNCFFGFIAFLLCTANVAAQQNIYDLESSREYAVFLYNASYYGEAALEYERILQLTNYRLTPDLRMFKAYRLAGDPATAMRRMHSLGLVDSPHFAMEQARCLYELHHYHELISFCKSKQSDSLLFFQSLAFGALSDWKSCKQSAETIDSSFDGKNSLLAICKKAISYRRKKAGISLALSAIIPGLGRVYTGNWKDGVFTLIFVGTFSWQAYSGFNRNGPTSVYAWVFTGLAGVFYLGNLYGSHRAAIIRNQKFHYAIQADLHNLYLALPN